MIGLAPIIQENSAPQYLILSLICNYKSNYDSYSQSDA